MTLIAPLTTTFTPPPHCTSSAGLHISEWKPSPAQGLWYAVGPLQSPPHFPCFPPSYNPTTQNYYSPGLCPSGYTPACTSRNTIASLTETIYTCCPTAQGFTFSCISDAPFSWMSTLACDVWLYGEGGTGMMTFEGVTFVDLEGRTKVTRTERSEVGIGAHGVEVRFQAGDF
ncbi:Gag poly protein, partial [Podospora aff. communis PSN243]